MFSEKLSLNLKLIDIKGSTTVGYLDEDVVSCFKFNPSGTKFVCGDRGGRCVVFERDNYGNYDFVCSIQSHEDAFDALRSVGIDKRINAVEWLNTASASDMFMSTNDRCLKLWRIDKRPPKSYRSFNTLNTME